MFSADANEALRWFRLSAAQGFPEGLSPKGFPHARQKVDQYASSSPRNMNSRLGSLLRWVFTH